MYFVVGAETCCEHVSALSRFWDLVARLVALAGGRALVRRGAALIRHYCRVYAVSGAVCSVRSAPYWPGWRSWVAFNFTYNYTTRITQMQYP